MTLSTKKPVPLALLVSIRTPKVSEQESEDSLRELERLVTTLGFRVTDIERQRMPSTTGSTAVGAGKLQEIADKVKPKTDLGAGLEPFDKKGKKAEQTAQESTIPTAVVFDCDLTPAQMRHIEGALNCEVLDRTGVIIEIFSRHARSRSSRLEVEIARLNYLSPRIREVGSSGERQSGRGSGESALATGRREIRDKLAELRRDLEASQREKEQRRSQRSDQLCVALVGYTNAGKSSTMRALTGSEVLVEDKLFATLDTTVRALKPETSPRILVSDTVGFIKKLPHDLVASFRSTLDEALNASLLLYIVDAGDPALREQLAVVDAALKEVGVLNTPVILVFNKIDTVALPQRKVLQREFPDSLQLSAHDEADILKLRTAIVDFFEQRMRQEELFVPYGKEGIIGEIRENMKVLRETHTEDGVRYLVRSEASALNRLKKKMEKST